MNMSILSERLKELRQRKNLKQSELAQILNTTDKAISSYETGRAEPPSSLILPLAAALDVSTDYLLGGNVEWLVKTLKNLGYQATKIEKQKKIPVYGSVAAGFDIATEAVELIEGYINTEEDADFALRVKGDSMTPVIPEGALVIVKKCSEVPNGAICVVAINGNEAVIKKFYKQENGILLVSANINHPPLFIAANEWDFHSRLIGKVVSYKVIF